MNTALLQNPRKKVRAIARDASTPAAHELFETIKRRKRDWSLSDWNAELAALDRCEDSISDWIDVCAS